MVNGMASKMKGVVALLCRLWVLYLPVEVQFYNDCLKHNDPRALLGTSPDFEKAPCREVIILEPWAVFIERLAEPEEELATSLLIWLLVPYNKPTSKNHYEVFAERASVEKHVSKQNNSLCHFFPTCIPSGNSDFFFKG